MHRGLGQLPPCRRIFVLDRIVARVKVGERRHVGAELDHWSAHWCTALLACPRKSVLKDVTMNCLHVVVVEVAQERGAYELNEAQPRPMLLQRTDRHHRRYTVGETPTASELVTHRVGPWDEIGIP